MTSSRLRGIASLVGLALVGGVANANATSPVRVEIVLSAQAAELLHARREAILLMVDYYGWPKKGAEGHGDDVGRIDFGPDRVFGVPGKSGRHVIPAVPLDPKRLRWIEGPVYINVKIASARLSGPDNLLSCDFIDAPLAEVEDAITSLRCGLIEGDPDSPR